MLGVLALLEESQHWIDPVEQDETGVAVLVAVTLKEYVNVEFSYKMHNEAYCDGRWHRRGGGGRTPRCGNRKDGKRKERSELGDVANHCE